MAVVPFGRAASDAISAAFAWASDARALKLFAAVFAVTFAFFLLNSVAVPQSLTPQKVLESGPVLLAAFIALAVLQSIVSAGVNLFIYKHFLNKQKLAALAPAFLDAARLFVLEIVVFFTALFPLVRPVLLAAPAAAIFLLAAASATTNMAITALAVIALAAWAVVGVLVFVRVSFAPFGMLSEKKGITDSVRYSWRFTEGRFWRALGLLAVPLVVVVVLVLLLSIVGGGLELIDGSWTLPVLSGAWQSLVTAFTGLALIGATTQVFATLRSEKK